MHRRLAMDMELAIPMASVPVRLGTKAVLATNAVQTISITQPASFAPETTLVLDMEVVTR